ncbi:MAG: hypothetical protein JJU09_14070 [Rhodobacteraceae bacterium]|nr:hypothetical protein [Paracoccaceae bacterium]
MNRQNAPSDAQRKAAAEARAARLKAALKANIARRKAQARARKGSENDTPRKTGE